MFPASISPSNVQASHNEMRLFPKEGLEMARSESKEVKEESKEAK